MHLCCAFRGVFASFFYPPIIGVHGLTGRPVFHRSKETHEQNLGHKKKAFCVGTQKAESAGATYRKFVG